MLRIHDRGVALADPEEPGVERLDVVEHAGAAHVVGVVEHRVRARRRPRARRGTGRRGSRRRRRRAARARRRSARRGTCPAMPTMAMSVSATSAGVVSVVGSSVVALRPRHGLARRAPAGASRRGRYRSGRRRPARPGRRRRSLQRAEVGGERADGGEAEDVGQRQRRAGGVAEPAEHLHGEQRVAADVEEVVVAPDRRARARRSRCRRRASRCRRPAARWRPGASAPSAGVGRAAPCGRSCRSA